LRNSDIVWNENHLNRWLQNPEETARNTNMEFRVVDAGERAAVVAFLKSAGSKADAK